MTGRLLLGKLGGSVGVGEGTGVGGACTGWGRLTMEKTTRKMKSTAPRPKIVTGSVCLLSHEASPFRSLSGVICLTISRFGGAVLMSAWHAKHDKRPYQTTTYNRCEPMSLAFC